MVTLIDRSDTESCQMIAPLIETLMKARENVFMQVHKCEQSNHHKERLSMLRLFLHYPITLRFREALNAIYSQTPDNSVTLTKMTRHLKGLITNFDVLFSFYDNTRGLLPTTFEHTDLLGYFLHFNGVSSLDDIFGEDAQFSGGENERILLSISIRRLLLMLLTPSK